MPDDLSTILAGFSSKGYVIAPAGYGKTHLIALAVKEANHRQLVLTHTYAGVNSIKKKMDLLGVPSSKYQVDTIASWILRLCLSYPKSTGWSISNPTSKQWNDLYGACKELLNKEFIKKAISATYSGIYVDEYQDCSDHQHAIVSALANILPCRILGDPLQAIFDFADSPVDWDKYVYPDFKCLGELTVPWRWYKEGANELGDWLNTVRTTLLAKGKVDLTGFLPKGVRKISVDLNDFKDNKRYSLFYDFLKGEPSETVIAMYGGNQHSKNKTHGLARSLSGKFSSIEEVEGKDLFSFLKKMQSSKTEKDSFLLFLDFTKKCFTGVDKVLSAGTKRAEISKVTKVTKYPEILKAANSILRDPSAEGLRCFVCLLRDNREINIYRRDLLNRFLNVLKVHIEGVAGTLIESAHIYQIEFRCTGRPVAHTKQIGTTLLVKGLEYDHAVILDADSLSMKELYVAMTRGSKTLTIITKKGSDMLLSI